MNNEPHEEAQSSEEMRREVTESLSEPLAEPAAGEDQVDNGMSTAEIERAYCEPSE